jgi:hypothetical protein
MKKNDHEIRSSKFLFSYCNWLITSEGEEKIFFPFVFLRLFKDEKNTPVILRFFVLPLI